MIRKTALPVLALIALAAAPVIAQQQPSGAPMGGDSAGAASASGLPGDGEGLYRAVCQSCHMADGKGGTGAATIPALAGNPRLQAAAYPIMMVAQGRGAMPGFKGMMDAAQIAAVTGYVCTHFGNACKGDRSPQAVKTLTASVTPRPAP